jgi:lipopolysaccharide biosynthesis protein
MLCWANENWTRRWDGQDAEILIAQTYETHDFDAHAKYLAEFMLDPRYIKIEGKPVFAIYRAEHFPDTRGFVQKLRESLKLAGVPDVVLLAMSRGASIDVALQRAGIDYIIDFQPDQKKAEQTQTWRKLLAFVSQSLRGEKSLVLSSIFPKINYSFRLNYARFVESAMKNLLLDGHLPCVFPTWDNSARRKHRATILQNDDPNQYRAWLLDSIQKIQNHVGAQVVFINAWNEWAEGCHLEPCQHWGKAYLEATRDALSGSLDVDIGNRV